MPLHGAVVQAWPEADTLQGTCVFCRVLLLTRNFHRFHPVMFMGIAKSFEQSVTSFSDSNGADRKASDGDDDLLLSEGRSGSPPVLERSGIQDNEKFAALNGLEIDLDLDLNLDLDAHDRAGLCFDEDDDAETLGGSQEHAEDLFFSDDGSLSDDTDLMADGAKDVGPSVFQSWSRNTIHIAVAEELDFDDLWASSQETLDVRASFRDTL